VAGAFITLVPVFGVAAGYLAVSGQPTTMTRAVVIASVER
jgi:hypothetical protein